MCVCVIVYVCVGTAFVMNLCNECVEGGVHAIDGETCYMELSFTHSSNLQRVDRTEHSMGVSNTQVL